MIYYTKYKIKKVFEVKFNGASKKINSASPSPKLLR